VVSVENVDGTDVLVDSEGRTLYTAEQEAGGRVLCTRSCTSDWNPVIASGEDAEAVEVDAELGVIDRPDGTEQLALEERPLYAFTQEEAGQLTGDGLVDEFEGTEFEWTAAVVGGADSADSVEPAAPGGYGSGGGLDY
jgi:predicted lipoprotein with Yx(FWY)xxD motif